ncbi:hypothetical protein JCM10449v2_005375 [Rhodotorula kratochvilovae]
MWSLLRQSLTPEAIHVYLPRTDDGEPADAVRARLAADEPVLAHPLVEVRFVPDEGPATKFLAVLREAFERARHSPAALEQPILVVDDDHVYSPALVETLATAFVRHGGEAAVALRGWRVREDLQWGVPWEDVKRHVIEGWRHLIEGWRLQDSYQVGVITANEGYLVTPSMFLSPTLRSLPPPTTSSLASLSPIFSSASPAAHLVDDILLSGVLANHSIPRVVVPLRAPEPPSVDITPARAPSAVGEDEAASPVERHLAEHGQSRAKANSAALRFFGTEVWSRTGEGWYDMRSERERREDEQRDEPRWAGWASRARSQVAKWGLYRRARARWGARVSWN